MANACLICGREISARHRVCSNICRGKRAMQVRWGGGDRFWPNVEKTETCWLWTGRLDRGYGQLFVDGRKESAHRHSYRLHKGPPDGLDVLHKCHVPRCVNPDHLALGTQADNNRDMRERGTQVRGTKVGSSRINPDIVRAIRGLRGEGKSYGKISAALSIPVGTVRSVTDGRCWSWVE